MSIEEKAEKLCSGFSLLDEKEQGYIWGILEALLFAKLKTDAERDKENGFINTR